MFTHQDNIRFYSTKEEHLEYYIQNSKGRAETTIKLLKKFLGDKNNLQVLEVGRMPDDFILTGISNMLAKDISILELPPYIGLCEKYDKAEEIMRIQLKNKDFSLHIKYANVEKDMLPWNDNSFDLVLFCEVIEHLLYDPVHALVELGRVLRPNGFLVLSTPNVLNWMNIVVLMVNHNPRDLYSGYGPYDRHNREYSSLEIQTLLGGIGFSVQQIVQNSAIPSTDNIFKKITCYFGRAITSLPIPFLKEKHGNTIITIAKKIGSIKPVYPRWLFRPRL